MTEVQKCGDMINLVKEHIGKLNKMDTTKIGLEECLECINLLSNKIPEYVQNVEDALRKFCKRKVQKDVITNNFIYGKKFRDKVEKLESEFGELNFNLDVLEKFKIRKLEIEQEMELNIKNEKVRQEKIKFENEMEKKKQLEMKMEMEREKIQDEKKLAASANEVRARKKNELENELESKKELIRIENELNAKIENNVVGLKVAIQMVQSKANSAELKTLVEALRIFISNICSQPENATFRQIKVQNPMFHQQIEMVYGGPQCMHAVGFRKIVHSKENEESKQEDECIYVLTVNTSGVDSSL